MQVKYETQLIESLPIKADDFNGQALRSRETIDTYTLEQSNLNPIKHISCNPVSNLAAVYVSKSQQIVLIDTKTYLKREKFPLKSCDKRFTKLSFTLKGLDFSPDGLKLAVGQTDCIIYIYKLPSNIVYHNNHSEGSLTSGLKPTISGKFVCSSPVTCLLWTDFGIVFGTQDGKVKLVLITNARLAENQASSSGGTNQQFPVSSSTGAPASSSSAPSSSSSSSTASKVISLYNPPKNPSLPVSLAAKYPIIAVGYVDSSVQVITLNSKDIQGDAQTSNSLDSSIVSRRSSSQASSVVSSTIKHSCPPYHLAILQANVLCCAGSDGRIVLHSIHGSNVVSWLQNVDIKEDILAIDYSSVNEIVAIVTTGRLLFLKHDTELNSWQLQNSFIELTQIFSISSLKWSKDGTQLLLGTLSGSLELFSCSWNKQTTVIGEQLDICHIAKNRVRITDTSRNLLATYKSSFDIKRVNLLDAGRNVIIWTTNSLLLARMGYPNLQSEIPWNIRDKSAKFSFKHLGYVLAFNNNTRELSVIRLGQDSVYYAIKFGLDESSPVKRKTICVRQYPSLVEVNQQQQVALDSSSSPTSVARQRSANSTARSRQASLVEPSEQSLQIKSLVEGIDRVKPGSVHERLAYVSESKCLLTIVNLKTKTNEIILKHTAPIEMIEFSNTSNYLIFTSRKELNLIDLKKFELGSKITQNQPDDFSKELLLDCCEFASWLPGTDILIAQSKHNISIWYNIEDLSDLCLVDSRSCNIINSVPILDLSLHNYDEANPRRRAYPMISRVFGDGIILTNKQTIPLDRIKVKFYVEISEKRFDSALELLLSGALKYPEKSRRSLMNKLGWIAIHQGNCEVAVKVFGELGYSSMVNCLQRCIESAEPEEREWRLAMLKGDWDRFEEIADAEHIIITYKRLNKWTRLIEYLSRSQQFRQRDLAEEEYRKWLVEKKRFLEAAEIFIKSSDLGGALELLVNNLKFEEALELFIRELKAPLQANNNNTPDKTRKGFHLDKRLLDLADRIKSQFIELKEFAKAARVSHKILDQQEEALELYLRAERFEEALELSKANDSTFGKDKVAQIEQTYARYLIDGYKLKKLSRKKVLPAIGHLLAAGLHFEALALAIELTEYQRAFEIVCNHELALRESAGVDESKINEYCNSIGHFMLERGSLNEAIQAYMICKNYDLVIKLCIDQADYERAFSLASEYLYGGDQVKTSDRFIELARDLIEREKAYEKAEKIYLMVNKHELAIEMHKAAGNHDRMLNLIEKFQPDFLESNLLLLARQLESQSRFEEAERYLLRASEAEWTNVVRMYRLANRWDDAFRVAKSNCSSPKDPLLVQLAFWWSKSLGGNIDESRKLLKDLKLFNQVVEFCCDNNNYQFAIDLCAGGSADESELSALRSKQADVVRRFASFLEESKKFRQAEQLLVKYGQQEEAVEMYIDNELYPEAIKLIEDLIATGVKEEESRDPEKLVDLLNRTLIKCANRIVEQLKPPASFREHQLMLQSTNGLTVPPATMEKLQRARQLFLRAQRPDLAVELYKERGMWQEAIQVAQRFAPQLLESVESALDAKVMSEVEPILAEVSASKKLDQSRSSGSSSRTSQVSSHSSSIVLQADQQQQVVTTTNKSFKQMASALMQNKAEQVMRNGADVKETKLALSKFMDTLIDGKGHLIEARQIKLRSWLSEVKRLAGSEGNFVSGRLAESMRNMMTISDRIISHASWGWREADNEPQGVWNELREVLASCRKRFQLNLEPDSNEQFLRRLLISHYASLHTCLVDQLNSLINLDMEPHPSIKSGASMRNKLVNGLLAPSAWPAGLSVSEAERLRNQLSTSGSKRKPAEALAGDILSLIGKLSLSLLRYADFLEPRQAFHVAGFWLLAANRPQLARFVWIRLMELTGEQAEQPESEATSRVEFELERAQIPTVFRGEPPSEPNHQLTSAIMGEIRQWLVGALIESSSHSSGRRISLDDRGQIESSLWGRQKPFEACLVSGYPVLAGTDRLVLSRKGSEAEEAPLNQARLSEWNGLLSMSRRLNQLKGNRQSAGRAARSQQSKHELNQEIDFIIRISGADRSLLKGSM